MYFINWMQFFYFNGVGERTGCSDAGAGAGLVGILF